LVKTQIRTAVIGSPRAAGCCGRDACYVAEPVRSSTEIIENVRARRRKPHSL
jgi:hypothetical protein